jgi:hypothetical protein
VRNRAPLATHDRFGRQRRRIGPGRPLLVEKRRPVVVERPKPRLDGECVFDDLLEPLFAPQCREIAPAAERQVPLVLRRGGRRQGEGLVRGRRAASPSPRRRPTLGRDGPLRRRDACRESKGEAFRSERARAGERATRTDLRQGYGRQAEHDLARALCKEPNRASVRLRRRSRLRRDLAEAARRRERVGSLRAKPSVQYWRRRESNLTGVSDQADFANSFGK